MSNLAVIDIGSNSITLVLAEIINNKYYKVIDILKETVRLGEDMGLEEKPFIKPNRMSAAIKTLRMFKNLCDATETYDVIAVATAAVRKAVNKRDFLKKVKEEIDLDVDVLSGEEEAFYDFCAVTHSLDNNDGLIIDVGGGSVELIWMKDRKIKKSVSLPFGALDLTQRFDLYDSIESDQEEKLNNYISNKYSELKWLSEIGDIPLIGVGGTVRNIAKIDQNKKDYPLEILHNYQMKQEEVKVIYNKVKSSCLEERLNIGGLSSKRADIFIGALALVRIIMDICNIDDLYICGKGIREGVIYNHLYPDGCSNSNDVLDFSIENFMYNFNMKGNHNYRIHFLTIRLYNQLKTLINLTLDNIDNIIKVAAILHDCGTSINYYDHHEHSFYIILNSGLNGLTHRELLMSAYIAASHRHTKYKLKKYNLNRSNFKQIINKNGKDKELIRKVGVLLEIAEGLDRNMMGIVEDVECIIVNDSVIIKTIAKEDIELEIKDALSAAKGFEKLFEKKLIIR